MRSISRFSYIASIWASVCNPIETYRQKKSARKQQSTIDELCALASIPTHTTQNLNLIISDFRTALERSSPNAQARFPLRRQPPRHMMNDLQDHIVTRLIQLADLDPLDTRDQLSAHLRIAPGQTGYDAILEFIDPDRITGKLVTVARLTRKPVHHASIDQRVTLIRKGIGLGILQGIIRMSTLPPNATIR